MPVMNSRAESATPVTVNFSSEKNWSIKKKGQNIGQFKQDRTKAATQNPERVKALRKERLEKRKISLLIV
jgi:hypothetical protein